ncbi:MAG: ribosome small subunit-dependent GTPase A, partial [Clostridia bacterium]
MPNKTTKNGRIVKCKNGFFTVETNDSGTCLCKAATRLRYEKKTLLPGDIAVYEDNSDGTGFVVDIMPRKNSFIRPGIANADVFVIVVATAMPEPLLYNIDKLTAVFAAQNTEIVIAANKIDIKSANELVEIYSKCGFKTFAVQAEKGIGTDEIKKCIDGKLTVFCGASGVGKSSLLNALYPKFKAEIGLLSEKIERGKNTTRCTELYKTSESGYIADTPGFSMIDFEHFDMLKFDDLKYAFPEMQP